jgi:hypothetical protein
MFFQNQQQLKFKKGSNYQKRYYKILTFMQNLTYPVSIWTHQLCFGKRA